MGKLAFVFPGQGAQYVGMGRELAERYPVARETFEEAAEVLGYDVADLCFNGPREALRETARTQPAILTASVACLRVLAGYGMSPHVVGGLSLGEYTASVAAGSIEFRKAVRLVERRGTYMQEAVPVGQGAMAAIIGLGRELVEEACRRASGQGVVGPANYNCPEQVVISGSGGAVRLAMKYALESGAKKAVELEVSAPFHCPLMEPAKMRIAEEIENAGVGPADVPIVANATASYVRTSEEIKSVLVEQISRPVLWEDCVRRMMEDGVDTFVEIGPGKTISGFIRRIDKGVRVMNVEDVASLEKVLDYWRGVC